MGTAYDDSEGTYESWLQHLVESREEWSVQRVLMETQLSSLESVAADPRSPEARALHTVLTAQCHATRTLLKARSVALDALLIAAADFTRSSHSQAATAELQNLLSRVARTLVEAQDEAARTLLAAQTVAADVLRSEQAQEAKSLLEIEPEDDPT